MQVAVGGSAGLVFVPDTVNAAVGDSVVFVFHSQNHTVTQSTFDTPCVKLKDGMDSGFMPNPNNTIVPPPMMAMQVTVATPLCKNLRFQDFKYPVSNVSNRVLLQAGPSLRKGHDFLHQPHRR